jgi:DNA segregation ATPase FtsK/SpoIIIE, S-DNA-T family
VTREERAREIAGYLLLILGGLFALAVLSYHPLDPSLFEAGSSQAHNLLSRAGALIAGVLVGVLGIPALIVPVMMCIVGVRFMRGQELETPGFQAIAWSVAVAGADGLLLAVLGRVHYRGGELETGGEVGRLVAGGLNESVGLVGTIALCAAALIAGSVFGVRGSLMHFFSAVGQALDVRRRGLRQRWQRRRTEHERERQQKALMQRHRERHPSPPHPALVAVERDGDVALRIRGVHHVAVVEEAVPEPPPPVQPPVAPRQVETPATVTERVAPPAAPRPPALRLKVQAVQEAFDFVDETPLSSMPEKTMLAPAPPPPVVDPQGIAAIRAKVESKCREFKVEGVVEDVLPGPVITTYEFRPAAGVRYAQVVNLEDDLALGLQVEAVRIERIPGKATVGIEVPNPERQTIVMREIVESSKFVHSVSPLTLALGKDVHGRPFVADLQRMPHLLIGGFTGSGKSVGINAMIMSILFKATPEQVRFILIDPKQVELGMYEKLPHLMAPIISDPREAARALKWAVREMRERYQLLASCKVRDIMGYNALIARGDMRSTDLVTLGSVELKPLPFIVIIIDELADLMMTCASDVEDAIGHLSQMARAVGIHLIFATQRPSVDIVTGVIKANFPCRIGYKVRTRFDSRTILDTEGAECLLGQGDMLFLPQGSSRPIRLHGCLVREEEILTVLKGLRRLGKPQFNAKVLEEPMGEVGDLSGDDASDPMFDQAARLVVSSRKASASFIQRKLRLGYARSARLLDMMERDGLVGPNDGSRGRPVLAPPDFFGELDAAAAVTGQSEENDDV